MRMVLQWLLPSHDAAAICTDSHSLQAIQSGSADTADLGRRLNTRAGKTPLLWIPGHHGNFGNENADACAKQTAAITGGAPRPVSFAAASALMHRTVTDPRPCHGLHQNIYMADQPGQRASACWENPSLRAPTTVSWRKPMQTTGHAANRLGSPVLLIGSNPGPHCYACGNLVRHGTSQLRCSTANCPTV